MFTYELKNDGKNVQTKYKLGLNETLKSLKSREKWGEGKGNGEKGKRVGESGRVMGKALKR